MNTDFQFNIAACYSLTPRDTKVPIEEVGNYAIVTYFHTQLSTIEELCDKIRGGYTLLYIYNQQRDFTWYGSSPSLNYIGTQYICIDVDDWTGTPEEFISSIKYKPTIWHTTFSNKTPEKNYMWRFHLIYVLDEILYNADNFKALHDILVKDYSQYEDKRAKSPFRMVFTSNSSLPDFKMDCSGPIYRISDFNLNVEHHDENPKTERRNLNKAAHYEVRQVSCKPNPEFTKDLFNMSRKAFIEKYLPIYPYQTSTYVPRSMYNENGYADLRNTEYYVVPSSRGYWNNETKKVEVPKVKVGFRNTMLFMDAIAFMKIIPYMTIEHLILCLVKQVYSHYDDPDHEFTGKVIMDKAIKVYTSIDYLSDDVQKVRRKFKINQDYWKDKGYDNWLEVSNEIRRMMRDDDLGSMYDFSQTLERNLSDMNDAGIKTTKRTLVKWLKNNGYEYCTEKDMLKMKVRELHCIQPDLTVRQIAEKTGIPRSTVQRYLKDKDYPCYDP